MDFKLNLKNRTLEYQDKIFMQFKDWEYSYGDTEEECIFYLDNLSITRDLIGEIIFEIEYFEEKISFEYDEDGYIKDIYIYSDNEHNKKFKEDLIYWLEDQYMLWMKSQSISYKDIINKEFTRDIYVYFDYEQNQYEFKFPNMKE